MKYYLIISLILFSLTTFCQSFEGRVEYKMDIENANPEQLPDSIFNMMFEGAPQSSQTYFYKKNNYKSITDGPKKSIQLYEPSKNRIYSYINVPEFAFWSEWNNNTTIEKLNLEEVIMGVNCKALLLKTKTSEVVLFYSDRYKVDISDVKTDNAWEKYLRIAGSIPLKYVFRGSGAPQNVVYIATNVAEEKLEENFFDIPNFKQVMKSPY